MKRKLKAVISIMLALMLTLSLMACGNTSSGTGSADNTETESMQIETEEETEEAFEEIVLLDDEEAYIVITGYEAGEEAGCTIYVTFENRSEEYQYAISWGYIYINDVQGESISYAAYIDPGESQEIEQEFTAELFDDIDIGRYTVVDVTLFFQTVDEDGDLGVSDTCEFILYPFGEENVVSYVRESQDSDIIFVDESGFTGVITGYGMNEDGSYDVYAYLENNSDDFQGIYININEINGSSVEGLEFMNGLRAGTCGFFVWNIPESWLEEISATEITELYWSHVIYDNGGNFSFSGEYTLKE